MTDLQLISTSNLKEVTTPMIAAIYVRVSTGRQEQEATMESQLDEVRTKIKADGHILPPENIFIDDGWTGEILQRPDLDRMRDFAREGRFQILYVYDRGRISRIFAHQEIVIEELTDRSIKFISLHDVTANTPETRVLQAMQGVFHEYERVKIAERMRRGKMYKARSGVLINGSALYGYNYIKKTDKKPTHCQLNEEEVRVILMIFDWVGNERISLHEVIRRLYDKGIPPRKRKSEFWTKGPIVRMLRCESYVTGIVYYNKSEAVVAKHPIKNEKYKKVKRNSRRARLHDEWIPYNNVPIVIKDRNLFDRVQKILYLNQKYARKNRKYNYLLTGLVRGECGHLYSGDGCSKNGHFYYRDTERISSFPLPRKCTSPGVNAVILDTLVWRELVKYFTNPSLLKQQAVEWLKSQVFNEGERLEKAKLSAFINKIAEEEKRYSKAYGEGILEFEQFKELTKETNKRKLAHQNQIDQLKQQKSHSVITIQVNELIEEVKKVLQTLDLYNKMQVVRDIIDKVILKERTGVEVWAHIALPAIQKLGYEPISRNYWSPKCGEVDAFQRASEKTGGVCGEFSVCDD